MTDLEKFQAVNKCESYDELAKVIESFADEHGQIEGRRDSFSAKRMAEACRNFNSVRANKLTREWGIRQQALYIRFYSE
ncbi:MAG: hypothetical protein ABFD07_10060 [Methanobacterium sp.]